MDRLFKQGLKFYCSYLLIFRKKGFYLFKFSILYPLHIVCVPFWKDSTYVNIWKVFVSNQLQFMWGVHAHAQACVQYMHTYIHTYTHTHTFTLLQQQYAIKTVMLKNLPLVYLERLINEGTYLIENVGSLILLRQSVLNLSWDLKIKITLQRKESWCYPHLWNKSPLLIPTFSIQLAALFEFLYYIN